MLLLGQTQPNAVLAEAGLQFSDCLLAYAATQIADPMT